MAKIYYDLIVMGLWERGNVPARWKDEVQALLDEDMNSEI